MLLYFSSCKLTCNPQFSAYNPYDDRYNVQHTTCELDMIEHLSRNLHVDVRAKVLQYEMMIVRLWQKMDAFGKEGTDLFDDINVGIGKLLLTLAPRKETLRRIKS